MKKTHFTFLENYPEHCKLQTLDQADVRSNADESREAISFDESAHKVNLKELWRLLWLWLEQWGSSIRRRWLFWLPDRIRIPWFRIFTAFMLFYLFTQRNVVFEVQWGDLSQESNLLSTAPAGGGVVEKEEPVLVERSAGEEVAKLAPWMEEMPGDTEKDKRYKAYIRRFEKVAKVEMEKFGVPASISMAQGLLESDGGASMLAKRNNNHFGMKCFSRSCKKGHCSNFSDDSHKDFFRIYKSAWESWRSHSKLLANGKYKVLKKYGDDYEAWARGLKRLGYATDPNYANNLIRLIKRYELWRLDK